MIIDLVDNLILKKKWIDIYDLLVGDKPYAKEKKNRSIRFRSTYISIC